MKQTIKFGKARLARVNAAAGVRPSSGSRVESFEHTGLKRGLIVRAGVVRVKGL